MLAPNLLWDTSNSINGEGQRELSDTTAINDIVETLIVHVDYFFRGFGPGTIDYFKEVSLEKPKHLLKSREGGDEEVKTPVPKPRQSRTPRPPLAPRPADRSLPQNQSTTHL